MNNLVFRVQGSIAEPYTVTIGKNDKEIFCSCTCPAGSRFQNCKHVLNILAGKSVNIISDRDDVLIAMSWCEGSTAAARLKELDHAELEYENAKAALVLAKKNIAKALYG